MAESKKKTDKDVEEITDNDGNVVGHYETDEATGDRRWVKAEDEK